MQTTSRLSVFLIVSTMGLMTFAAAPPPPFRAVDRVAAKDLIKTVTEHIKDNPNDAHARYLLGLIHFTAYEQRRIDLQVFAGNHKLPNLVKRGDSYRPGPGVPPTPGQRASSQAPKQAFGNKEAKEHLVKAVQHFEKAVRIEKSNGYHHMWLADAFHQLATNTKTLAPIARAFESDSKVTSKVKQQIDARIDVLLADNVSAREKAEKWLVDHGQSAEPILTERLLSANQKTSPRLQKVLAAHWNKQAIEHYYIAHDLMWKQDVAGYNPAFGESWDKFTSLRSGHIFLELTKDHDGDQTERRRNATNEHFAALARKIKNYDGPVR